MARLRRYFISGLLVWVPVWVTVLVIMFVIELLDASLTFIPEAYHPDKLLGIHIPGLGVILTLLLITGTGMLVTNIIGNRLVEWSERFISRIPLVRTIYQSVKQVLTTVFSTNGQAFRKVMLVEYPRAGSWSIAFQTSNGFHEAVDKLQENDLVTVFVPTTPNPTSGFLILVPRKDVRPLNMAVDDALKMVISLGVIQPSAIPAAPATPLSAETPAESEVPKPPLGS